jgi:peptide/nickel transport system permease protein
MLAYLLKRILLFIPTLILISLLAFVISVSAPGDPVDRLSTAAESGEMSNAPAQAVQEQKIYWSHRLGLDLPVFYFSIIPLSYPDTLYKIVDKTEREALKSFLNSYGKWEQISAYHASLEKLNRSQDQIKLDSLPSKFISRSDANEAINQSRFTIASLLSTADPDIIEVKVQELAHLFQRFSFFDDQMNLLKQVEENYNAMVTQPVKWKHFVPSLHFYPQNQYHRWLFGDGNALTGKGSTFSKGLIRGDLGISYTTKMPVTEVIARRLGWSLFFTLSSVLLAYLVSIPIGIRAAVHHGSLFDRTSTVLLFILHSMPIFWVATLLLMTFANPDALYWFPTTGVKPVTGYPPESSFLERVRISLPYIMLPLIAYTYSSLAFLSRITRVAMLETIQQDYIRTARAKGLPENTVVYKHAFRNALLPIITVFANVFPAAIGGSVILETIFTIPGMGLETYQAIQSQNYPMIVGVFTLTGVLTLVGYLVADILYALADPRISFSKK